MNLTFLVPITLSKYFLVLNNLQEAQEGQEVQEAHRAYVSFLVRKDPP